MSHPDRAWTIYYTSPDGHPDDPCRPHGHYLRIGPTSRKRGAAGAGSRAVNDNTATASAAVSFKSLKRSTKKKKMNVKKLEEEMSEEEIKSLEVKEDSVIA